jgi:hypothetical protein
MADDLPGSSGDFVLFDEAHLRELDNTSRAAREARDGLNHEYKDRTAQLRASMQRSKSSSEVRNSFHLRRLA